jgi:hypothetical protein
MADMSKQAHGELVELVGTLPAKEQRRVLEFARALADAKPQGTPGSDLIRFAGTISPDELARMSQAIEEGCEQVDANAW